MVIQTCINFCKEVREKRWEVEKENKFPFLMPTAEIPTFEDKKTGDCTSSHDFGLEHFVSKFVTF